MGIQEYFEGSGSIAARHASTELDCESAALLRAAIRPLFSNAASWASLADILRDKGYHLAFRQGHLCISDHSTGECVCGLHFLGFELCDLVRHLGRPIVVARGCDADGDILTVRPTP